MVEHAQDGPFLAWKLGRRRFVADLFQLSVQILASGMQNLLQFLNLAFGKRGSIGSKEGVYFVVSP